MKITYDPEVDALYIRFRETTVTTQHLAEGIAADYDVEGHLAGIEILEIRISKYETMTEIKNVPMTKTLNFQWVRFDHFVIWYSNLFRISDLDIRILPEHDFSFRQ